jgi:hypothetical protein
MHIHYKRVSIDWLDYLPQLLLDISQVISAPEQL